jgi:hypothetical protein
LTWWAIIQHIRVGEKENAIETMKAMRLQRNPNASHARQHQKMQPSNKSAAANHDARSA